MCGVFEHVCSVCIDGWRMAAPQPQADTYGTNHVCMFVYHKLQYTSCDFKGFMHVHTVCDKTCPKTTRDLNGRITCLQRPV